MDNKSSSQPGNPNLTAEALIKQFIATTQANSPENKKGSHGMTVGEHRQLHEQQRVGIRPMIPANNAKGIMIYEADKHLLHAILEDTQFDSKTGNRISKPWIQMYYPEDFKRMSDSTKPSSENAFRHLSVTVVHDPSLQEAEVVTGAEAPDKVDAAKTVEAKNAAAMSAGPRTLSKATLNTFNKKDLTKVYNNMFPEAEDKEPTLAVMRAEISARLDAVEAQTEEGLV